MAFSGIFLWAPVTGLELTLVSFEAGDTGGRPEDDFPCGENFGTAGLVCGVLMLSPAVVTGVLGDLLAEEPAEDTEDVLAPLDRGGLTGVAGLEVALSVLLDPVRVAGL